MIYTYKALATEQVLGGLQLVLFSAPAHHIALWAGIPQRQLLGDEETVGFQRDLNPSRVAQLAEFYSFESNVMQNPLLAAMQQGTQVLWKPNTQQSASASRDLPGKLTIRTDDLGDLTLLELMTRVRARLEHRDASLCDVEVPPQRIDQLKAMFDVTVGIAPERDEDDFDDFYEEADADELGDVFFDVDSHIDRFWIELDARIAILDELGEFDGDSFLGFTRDALEAYLRPVLLVDGQHRLAGALAALENALVSEPVRKEMAKRIRKEDPELVRTSTRDGLVRHLPVSMLMTAEAAEHVFQFVVVNQRATPIRPALLGSIVATSLADEELEPLASRLRQAGIPLEESRAISYMTRRPESPFFGLVRRGIGGETAVLLEWNVMGGLINVFRNLRGGRLFGQRTDHADRWRRRQLPVSEIVAEYATNGAESP